MPSKKLKIVNIHEAKTHLSRLIEEAVNGEPFVIAKAGVPMVKVVPYSMENVASERVGFMKGKFQVPEDFDELAADEIRLMVEGPL